MQFDVGTVPLSPDAPELESTAPSTVSKLDMTSPLSKLFSNRSPIPGDDQSVVSDVTDVTNNTPASAPTQKSALAAKLEKKKARLSFKKPNFKGLLNDNGIEDFVDSESPLAEPSAAAAIGEDTPKRRVPVAESKQQKGPKRTPLPPRSLSISVRPVDPMRSGYLQKLDTSNPADLGEDSWLDQAASLEIATGELKLYAEIGGRKLLRGTMNINDFVVQPIDYVFYGKVFSFELLTKREDGTPGEEAAAAFATDNVETYSYWLISFEDCKTHQENIRKAEALRLEEEKQAAEAEAAAMAAAAAAVETTTVHKVEDSLADATSTLAGHAVVSDGTTVAAAPILMRAESRKSSFTPFTHDDSRNPYASLDDIEGIQQVTYTGSGRSTPDLDAPELLPEHPSSSQKAPSSNRLLSGATSSQNVKVLERQPSASNMRSAAEKASHRHAVDLEEALGTGVQRVNSRSAAGDLEFHGIVPQSFRTLPSLFGTAIPESQESNAETPGSMLLSPNTTMLMQEAFSPEMENLQLRLEKLLYPTERLVRRIKIWYCSSGFSISTETDVENFVRELRNTDDKILHAFSHEKFSYLHDWAKLLEMLRKYEEHSASDPTVNQKRLQQGEEGDDDDDDRSPGRITFVLRASTVNSLDSTPRPPVKVKLLDTLEIDGVARKVRSPSDLK